MPHVGHGGVILPWPMPKSMARQPCGKLSKYVLKMPSMGRVALIQRLFVEEVPVGRQTIMTKISVWDMAGFCTFDL